MSINYIKVKQVRSEIGRLSSHKSCLRGLGIRRMNQVVHVPSTPQNIGMIRKISYMLKVEEL